MLLHLLYWNLKGTSCLIIQSYSPAGAKRTSTGESCGICHALLVLFLKLISFSDSNLVVGLQMSFTGAFREIKSYWCARLILASHAACLKLIFVTFLCRSCLPIQVL